MTATSQGSATGRIALGFEGDLVETAKGAVVILRFEAYTVPDDPLAGEVLLAPGGSPTHFESLKHLTHQPRIGWFFASDGDVVLRAQHYPLGEEHHRAVRELLGDAVRHDALVRMTTGYDEVGALREVASRYAPDSSGGRGDGSGGDERSKYADSGHKHWQNPCFKFYGLTYVDFAPVCC